jgi:osmotically-inducible protein OsmY
MRMRSLAWILGLLLLGAIIGPVVWADETKPQQVDGKKSADDLVITARVEMVFLMSGDLNPFRINSSTTDGIVSLEGSVREQMDKDLAGRLAKSVKGVKSVVNNLKVERNAPIVEENAKWRQTVEDASLNSRIRRRIAYNSGLQGAVLDVDVTGSHVTITGDVDSAEKKAEIERIVRDTSGVAKLDSNLKVVVPKEDTVASAKPGVTEDLTDEWIEKMVEASVMSDTNLSIKTIDVEVDQGVCTLSGTVISQAQKDLAGSIAKSTNGVKSVVNNITVNAFASAASR